MEQRVYRLHAEILVELTDQDIDKIMACVLGGAINHWCAKVDILSTWLDRPAIEQISRGGTLGIWTIGSSFCFHLDQHKLLYGIKQWLEKGNHVSVNDNTLDCNDITDADADCIIQFALFYEMAFDSDGVEYEFKKHLINEAEDLGWSVNVSDNNIWEFHRSSPAGEDFGFSVNGNHVAENVVQYADCFDPEEHVMMNMEAKKAGLAGVPVIKTLCDDADAIKKMIKELADTYMEAAKENNSANEACLQ